jgi:SAM-dependent methyltransferase
MRSQHTDSREQRPSLPAIQRPFIEVLLEPISLSTRELKQIERWDALSNSQSERINLSRQSIVEQSQREILEKYPALKEKSATILDLGAGIGCATNIFREYSDCVVAIDLSSQMLEQARTLPAKPYHRLIQYSITSGLELSELRDNPIINNSIDGIVCFSSFQNFVNPGQQIGQFDLQTGKIVLERMFNLLKPGAIAAIQYIIPQDAQFSPHTTLIDPIFFRKLCEDCGFIIGEDKKVLGYNHKITGEAVYYQHVELVKPAKKFEYLLDNSLTEFEQLQIARRDALAPTQTSKSIAAGCTKTSYLRQTAFINEHPSLLAQDKLILAFGLPGGGGTTKFRELGANVVGLEISPNMAAVAALDLEFPYEKVIVYSPLGNKELSESKEPIYDGSVDCIISYGSLSSFIPKADNSLGFDKNSLEKVLHRMHRLLRPGGIIAINFIPPHDNVRFHDLTTVMNPESFGEVLQKVGFSIKSENRSFAYRNESQNADVSYQFIEAVKLNS